MRQVETWLAREPRQVAGTLLAVCAGIVLMGIITAEALYRGNYTTTHNTISYLGANPLHAFALRPSAVVFDATMIAAGLLVLGRLTRCIARSAGGASQCR